MAGLLEGLGVIVGTMGAQGAKAYGESTAEQSKQEAISLRETNMLRIKDIMDSSRQENQNKFTAGQSDKEREHREKLAAEAEMGAVSRLDRSLTHAEDLARESDNQSSMRLDTQIDANKDTAAAMVQANKDAAAALVQARKDETVAAEGVAKRLASYKQGLDDSAKTSIEKTIDGLVKGTGMPRAQASAIALADATKEQTKLETIQLRTWADMYMAELKIEGIAGTPSRAQADKVAAGVTSRLGFDPASIVAKGAGPATTPKGEAPKETAKVDPIAAAIERVNGKGATKKDGVLSTVASHSPVVAAPPPAPTAGPHVSAAGVDVRGFVPDGESRKKLMDLVSLRNQNKISQQEFEAQRDTLMGKTGLLQGE